MTDKDHLQSAIRNALRSKDPSTRTGAVLVSEGGFVLGRGRNQMPFGIRDTLKRWHDRELKLATVIHAEMAALLQAAEDREVIPGSTLYNVAVDTASERAWGFRGACTRCAAHLIHAGVRRIVTVAGNDHPERWAADIQRAVALLEEAGVELAQIEL